VPAKKAAWSTHLVTGTRKSFLPFGQAHHQVVVFSLTFMGAPRLFLTCSPRLFSNFFFVCYSSLFSLSQTGMGSQGCFSTRMPRLRFATPSVTPLPKPSPSPPTTLLFNRCVFLLQDIGVREGFRVSVRPTRPPGERTPSTSTIFSPRPSLQDDPNLIGGFDDRK